MCTTTLEPSWSSARPTWTRTTCRSSSPPWTGVNEHTHSPLSPQQSHEPLSTHPPLRFHGNERCVCGPVDVTQQFSQVQWDDFAVEVLDSLYNTAPVYMHCNQSTARLFSVSTSAHAHTHTLHLLQPTQVCSIKTS